VTIPVPTDASYIDSNPGSSCTEWGCGFFAVGDVAFATASSACKLRFPWSEGIIFESEPFDAVLVNSGATAGCSSPIEGCREEPRSDTRSSIFCSN